MQTRTHFRFLDGFGIGIHNHKSIGREGIEIIQLKPVNVFIGRNNSGKSAIMDTIELLHCGNPTTANATGSNCKLTISKPLSEPEVRQAFRDNTHGGPINGNHWDAVGTHLVGKRVVFDINAKGIATYRSVELPQLGSIVGNIQPQLQQLSGSLSNPFLSKTIARLSAERDIQPESDEGEPEIINNGTGFTRTVAQLVNNVPNPRTLIEQSLLAEVNRILGPDGNIRRLAVRRHPSNKWELFLDETDKGLIPLSASGTGLKTIFLVASFTIILPFLRKRPLEDFVFVFEELEGNLHPALQRRLFNYLRNLAVDDGATIFITTHSGIVIDQFSRDTEASIYHVRHDGRHTNAERVITYHHNHGVLDDLDIRASDLLQANGLVWLEGPSDRLYFNRWIEIAADGTLREGTHYQCVFYGGRLLAHLAASDEDKNDLINILRVNRNALIMIDSDKDNSSTEINATKNRMASEIEQFGGISWITAGREVENYLAGDTLKSLFPSVLRDLQPFEDICRYIKRNVSVAEANKFERGKVLFAERALPHITKEGLPKTLDLASRLSQASEAIKRWNKL